MFHPSRAHSDDSTKNESAPDSISRRTLVRTALPEVCSITRLGAVSQISTHGVQGCRSTLAMAGTFCMKSTLKLGTVVVLSWAIFLVAQTDKESEQHASTEPDAALKDFLDNGLAPTGSGPGLESLEILSDTLGVDFGPYLLHVMHGVKRNWYNLIPDSAMAPLMKKSEVRIEFAITKSGQIVGLRYVISHALS
jgi:hypothetical protein